MNQILGVKALLVGVVGSILVASACSKSIEVQSGTRSEQLQSASSAPALSVSPDQSTPSAPSDMTIARAESSPESAQRIEDMRQEQRATNAAALQDVFFDFDRWSISDQGRAALQADAEWLRSNPTKKVTIQGHCDERGTSAYNLVLGERRARAIRQFLVDFGIKPDRLTQVSYGKERPFCQERNEGCYQMNRRGHLAVQVH